MLIEVVTEWRSNQSNEFKDAIVWNPKNLKQMMNMMNTVDTLSHASKVMIMRTHGHSTES
jgi:hypothetical protein